VAATVTASKTDPRTAATRGAVYFVAWTVVAVATTELQAAAQPDGGEAFGRLIRMSLASCWLWALYTPAILTLSRRVRIDRTNWLKTVPIHLGTAALATFIDVALMRAIAPYVNPGAPPSETPLHVTFLRTLFLYSLCYFVIVALAHVRYYASLSYERDLRAATLETQLAEARLTALQGQLRPHFLFNTLNMIAEQVYTDPAGADAMLTRLGVLLRSSFTEADRECVPLRRELELLESYVEIMRARFRGRLTFELHVDPATLDALVPRFILQPLVENAIKHGVEPREEGGRVTVTARHDGGSVDLEVRDNGDGLAGAIREGTGVRNTRQRLLHLYGTGRQEFALTPAPGGGTIALVVVPFDIDDEPPATFTAAPRLPAYAAVSGRRSAVSTPTPVVSHSALRRSAS